MSTIRNYIGGELVEPAGREYLDNIDPATGKAYSQVPDSDQRDVDRAVEAARRALPIWSASPVAERMTVLNRVADLIERAPDALAQAECIDTGKPLSLARTVDIPRAALNLRFFASSVMHFASESHQTDDIALNYTLRKPRGVCGVISPWNLPLYLLTWKVAPALAAGNTVIAKPSEVTPMTAHLLSKLCIEAGLPPGVLNIVHGRGPQAGAEIVRSPDIPTISFTGGTATGKFIAETAAPMLKKYSLELGGKNPNIVFADADLKEAIPGSLRAAFTNQGQVCLCGSRLLVERKILNEFTQQFVAAAKDLKVGDPLDENTQQGAVVSKAQYEKVLSYLQIARDEGAKILCGGGPATNLPERCREGYFIAPTVLTNLDMACRVNREEIFGPVVSIIPFDTEEGAISMANDVDYGLSASLWTSDLTRAHRVADRLDVGTVWINCWLLRDLRVPFGGMKQSGVGREGGVEALRFFTEPKNVCVRVGG